MEISSTEITKNGTFNSLFHHNLRTFQYLMEVTPIQETKTMLNYVIWIVFSSFVIIKI